METDASLGKYNCPNEKNGESNAYGIYMEANVDCQGKSRRAFAHDRGHERSSRGRSGQEQAHFLPVIAGN